MRKEKKSKKHLPALLSAAGVNAFVNFFFVACVNGSAFQFNDDWPHFVLCCFAQFVLHMRTFILFYFYGFAADCHFLSAYTRCCWCCCVCCCCCQSTICDVIIPFIAFSLYLFCCWLFFVVVIAWLLLLFVIFSFWLCLFQ